jgi:hypothetical protein
MKIKTQHLPPQHCGYCEQMHDTTKCKRLPKPVHLSENCVDKNCVEGWLDYFDENVIYLFTKPCVVCLPDTWDYVNQYPPNASKLDSKGIRNGRSLSTQRKMQEMRSKKLASLIPNVSKGKKK